MEEELSLKMNEFMTVIDQVKKYRALLAALPDLVIIIALSIIAAISADVSNKLGIVYISYLNANFAIGNSLTILSIVTGIVIGFFWVRQKMNRTKVGLWKSTLKEGAPGAITLLQNLNWADTFRNIRYAKLGFWLYGLLKTATYWILTFAISTIAAGYLSASIHWSINSLIVGLFSLALVLALNKNDFKKRFDQIGQLDALLWELRWFDNDFRRADFKA